MKDKKLELEYPCTWLYKVIGENEEKIRKGIAGLLQEPPHSITLSNTSSKGKYYCLNIEVTVKDETERNSIFSALKAHPAVKMVL